MISTITPAKPFVKMKYHRPNDIFAPSTHSYNCHACYCNTTNCMAYCRRKILQHNLFSTQNKAYNLLDNNSCNLNKVELLLSMQGIHNDLRGELVTLAEETQPGQMHLELKQSYFDEQITDYEHWLDLEHKEEVILTQEIQVVEKQHELEQCYFDDQITDYENWLELQHASEAINIQHALEAWYSE
jgi:hypothetical protein